MDILNKPNEELIIELQELQLKYNSLKASLENDIKVNELYAQPQWIDDEIVGCVYSIFQW
jgi:hypothetical protein